MECICSVNLVYNVFLFCSVYLLGQSSHFNWYIPHRLYLSDLVCFGFRIFLVVLLVLNAMPMLVFLNSFVINFVSWFK